MATVFIGRNAELYELQRLLTEPDCRLVTVVGAGGMGKTRLVWQAADRLAAAFPDGIYRVALQAIQAPHLVAYEIAQALGVRLYEKDSPLNQLLTYVQDKRLLLVLDNFEHLLDALDVLVALLAQTTNLKLLVTSREVLNLAQEYVLPLHGLPYPAQNEDILSYDAVRLFAELARQVRPDFVLEAQTEQVLRICRLVEGMPLGIELAAAWVRTLPCVLIADQIEQGLDLLATQRRDVAERHRSIQAVFDTSWQRLNPTQQAVFMRLAVFRGYFEYDAARAVTLADIPTLAALVDQSLLRLDEAGRYTMHELLRQYAAQHLHKYPNDEAQTRSRHSAYYLGFVAAQDTAIKCHQQIDALNAIESRLDNIRIAWEWAVEHEQITDLVSAYDAMTLYYQIRCRLQEAFELFAHAVRHLHGQDSAFYAMLLLGESWFGTFNSRVYRDWDTRIETAGEMLLRHQQRGIAALTLGPLRYVDNPRYTPIMDENRAAYEQQGNQWGVAWSLFYQGTLLDDTDAGAGEACYRRALPCLIASVINGVHHGRGAH